MGKTLADWCMRHTRTVFATVLLAVIALSALIPMIVIDTDPENMLSAEQPDRVVHNAIRDRFNLYDMIVVGQVAADGSSGIFNPESLAAHHALTRAIEDIEGVIAELKDGAADPRSRRRLARGHLRRAAPQQRRN